jgi:hypothetical protein
MYYAAEPAPMGIADFGIDSQGNGLTYNTSAFLGDTYIRSLSVGSASIGSTALTIQLNIVLTFNVGNGSYQYWVQDVAFLDTSNNNLSFENNIWNFSLGQNGMDGSSVSGNGSIYGGQVYIAVAFGVPGAVETISYPTHIGLLASTKVVGGVPEVVFEYSDGHGWVTYDNAIFPFAHGATDVNYTVDGTNYNPIGLFDDAELTLGGPGGGSQTTANAANLSMTLAFYNGRNYQSIQNAYNFGSDTAEGIDSVVPSLGLFRANGTLSDNLTYGSGSLSTLFDNSFAGIVNVITQVVGGTVVINGTHPIPFTVQPINLTLAPGNYSFAVYQGATLMGQQSATLTPGGFLQLFIAAGTVSTVLFQETGLTPGHRWSVTYGSATTSSTSSTIHFLTINGSFNYRILQIPGFIPNVTHGSVLIAGQGLNISLNFFQVVYPVQLFETGLPSNTTWSVTVANQTFATDHVILSFTLPNGSFGYTVGAVPGWSIAPQTHGTLQIAGRQLSRTLVFHQFTYTFGINETGLPKNTAWGIEVGGVWVNGSAPVLEAFIPNGSFAYRITTPAGWIASSAGGNSTIAARALYVQISFLPFRFPVTFESSGLPNGTLWGVQVGSDHETTTNASLMLLLPNGSYFYAPDVPAAFLLLTPENGTLLISGFTVNIGVVYGPQPAIVGFLIGSIIPGAAILLINGSEETTSGGLFNVTLFPGAHSLEVFLSGYRPFFENVTIIAGARTVLKTIVLTKITPVSPGPGGGSGTTDSGTPFGLSTLELEGLLAVAALGVAGTIALAARRNRR